MTMYFLLTLGQLVCVLGNFDPPTDSPAQRPPARTVTGLQPTPGEDGRTMEDVLQEFLTAMIEGDQTVLRRITLPNPELSLLWRGEKLTAAQKATTKAGVSSSSFRRLKVGDAVQTSGKKVVLDLDRINVGRQEIVVGNDPLPFVLVKDDYVWKVDASAIIAARGAAAAARERKTANSRPNWTADPKLIDQLGQETVVGGLAFRPPTAFEPGKYRSPLGPSSNWVSDERKDGSWASIIVSVGPADDDANHSLLVLVDALVAVQKSHAKDWSQDPPELGRIDDLVCARVRWSGTLTSARKELLGRRARGTVYIIAFGSKFVVVMLTDVMPDAEKSLPLCEASIQTLRRIPQTGKTHQ
jgi:hypothetical protein